MDHLGNKVESMPGPTPPQIVLNDAEHRELERLVCAHKTGQALVRRARVVLLAAMGTAIRLLPSRFLWMLRRWGSGGDAGSAGAAYRSMR